MGKSLLTLDKADEKGLLGTMRILLAAAFFGFICSVIFMADKGIENPFSRLAEQLPGGDKLGHFVLFGILTALLNLALKFRCVPILKRQVPLGALIVLAFAGIEELSQVFFPTRTLDLIDFLADVIGVSAFSSLSFALWRSYRRRKTATPEPNQP